MAVTPYIPAYKTLQLELLINGTNNGLHTVLKKVEVHYELNKIPYAKLQFISSNPDIDAEDNPLESDTVAVTDEIEININTGEDTETLFKGIVHRVERNADPNAGFETKIDCKDICVNLTSQQDIVADETFSEKMDRFLNELSIANNVDLSPWGDEIVSKPPSVTPWDYIISYIDRLGFMATIREGEFNALDTTAPIEDAVFLAKNGSNVFEFEGTEETTVETVQVQYWNPETQEVENQESSTDVENGEGIELIDMSQSNFKPDTISQISKAVAARNRLATLKGKVKTFGNLTARYGQNLTFEKVNPSMDGKPLLISVEHHTIENGCWDTEYNFGLEGNQSFAENINATSSSNSAAARSGQINSVQGLQIGVVTQLEDDPNNEFRIRVNIPSIASSAEGVWARLSSFMAGSERGAFFIPEVGDEVVLGCFNNNPDTPVILGKLFSSAHEMPFPIEEANNIQGIVSKEESKIIINDEEKSVEISTKNGNKLLISDASKGFVFEDENGNKIVMDDKGITIESPKDITLKATGDLNAEGKMSSLKATANMELSGKLIKLN